jgi:hypothetical protein
LKIILLEFNNFVGLGARQSYGPISVALSDGIAIKPLRINGPSIEIDEVSLTVFVDANISISFLQKIKLMKK